MVVLTSSCYCLLDSIVGTSAHLQELQGPRVWGVWGVWGSDEQKYPDLTQYIGLVSAFGLYVKSVVPGTRWPTYLREMGLIPGRVEKFDAAKFSFP